VRALTALLAAMANESPTADMRVEETARDVRLWQATRFTLLRTYATPGLIGERYRLTNLGDAALALEARWLDREGVLGVAIEQATLEPQASTQVFVLRAATP
jgi:hypothetical protein